MSHVKILFSLSVLMISAGFVGGCASYMARMLLLTLMENCWVIYIR